MPSIELEILGDTAVNKTNTVSALTEFSLTEISEKEQTITTQRGKGYAGRIKHTL